MKDEDLFRVTRWIDGELTDQDISDLLQREPTLREQREAARGIGQRLRQEFDAEREVHFPEMFNRQILRRIEEEQKKTVWSDASRFFSWLTLSEWGLPVAASATLMLFLCAGLQFQGARHFRSRVVHTFTPNPAHAAQTKEIGRAGVAVISVQGLEPVPGSTQVMGFFPTQSRPDALAEATTFLEGEQPRLLLSLNQNGEPRLTRLR